MRHRRLTGFIVALCLLAAGLVSIHFLHPLLANGFLGWIGGLPLAVDFALVVAVGAAALLLMQSSDKRAMQLDRDYNQEILDNIQDVVFRTDANGRWTSLNPAWENITGYTVKESLGWSTMRLLHSECLPEANRLYPRLASGEVTQTTLHQRFYDRHGQCRHIQVTVRRLQYQDGRFAGTTGTIRDVTEQTRQADALAASEQRFRTLAESAPIGIFQANSLGQLTFISKSWAKRLGRTVEDMMGTGWFETVVNQQDYLDDPPFHGFTPGMVKRREICFRRDDGEHVWMETFNSAEFDEYGTVVGFYGAAIDVTDQRLAKARLDESERRFQALASLAPAGIFRTDAMGQCSYVNEAWLDLAGLRDGEWEGGGWLNALHPDDRNRIATAWAATVATAGEFREEFRWLRPDGSEVWVDTIGRPELDAEGHVAGFVGVNLDITEGRNAEIALAERDRQLTIITENMTDTVVRLKLDGTCLYASPSASELFNIHQSALVGINLFADLHPEDEAKVRETFAELTSGARRRALIAFRSGAFMAKPLYRWIEANCATLRDSETGEIMEIIASLRNVAQTKALEAELRNSRREAEDAAKAKSEFLANMSHEIRTPMNGVMGFTDLMQQTVLDETQAEYVRMIADSGRTMMRLLNDILDISKIEAGLMTLSSEPVDLHTKLRSVTSFYKPLAKQKGIELNLHIADGVPRWVAGDPLRLRQSLLNLVGNAIKFTSKGGVSIEVVPATGMDGVTIAVSDTGIGIAEDKLDAIFEQFTQADPSVGRRFGGSGLGLAITASLVTLMDGGIDVTSKEGKGSRFALHLPLKEIEAPADAAQPALAGQTDGGTKPGRTLRILVAEDNEINQKLVGAMIDGLGHKMTLVGDGCGAVRAVMEASMGGSPFDLVLMDLQMPCSDGITATRQLREQGVDAQTLPIVALTANAYQEDVARCLAAGMQDHLAKPLTSADLTRTIARWTGEQCKQADAPAARPISPGLQVKYDQRKAGLRDLLTQIDTTNVRARWPELADALHQLAGTAALFGDAPLGARAAEIERDLREATDDSRLIELVEESVTELDRAA